MAALAVNKPGAGVDSGRQGSRGTAVVKVLECGVCEDVFSLQGDKVPRLLLCGHTVCHDCLTRLPLHGRAIRCPFDRQVTDLGDSGVWGLKKNFALLELLERLQNGHIEFVCLEEGCQTSPLMCCVCKEYGKHQGHKHSVLEPEANQIRASILDMAHCIRTFTEEISDYSRKLVGIVQHIEGGEQIVEDGIGIGSLLQRTRSLVPIVPLLDPSSLRRES